MDIERPDGGYIDGGCYDDLASAKAGAEKILQEEA